LLHHGYGRLLGSGQLQLLVLRLLHWVLLLRLWRALLLLLAGLLLLTWLLDACARSLALDRHLWCPYRTHRPWRLLGTRLGRLTSLLRLWLLIRRLLRCLWMSLVLSLGLRLSLSLRLGLLLGMCVCLRLHVLVLHELYLLHILYLMRVHLWLVRVTALLSHRIVGGSSGLLLLLLECNLLCDHMRLRVAMAHGHSSRSCPHGGQVRLLLRLHVVHRHSQSPHGHALHVRISSLLHHLLLQVRLSELLLLPYLVL
jgi:hypothetical protein